MCLQYLWKRPKRHNITTNINSPIIIVSPFVQPTVLHTPILPKKCSFCNGIMFNKRQSYHKECFHSAVFNKNKEREQKKKNISNSF